MLACCYSLLAVARMGRPLRAEEGGRGKDGHIMPARSASFGGTQAKMLKEALDDRAVLHTFGVVDGAGDHCAVAALKLRN
ncbi:hypothetical protein GGTG_00377 [Gaeumannomyces tritici R3-111a-1]|uniref:Uncharacterized protein n=1 Tax=Gaeumannomyces tritici (strain R3-111a-1) TaxID=644352 RepID=J3NGI7_GAET3|nr:hypothetical protein GGTG_00377 [Gaeumannomyces tritici R3-111a-1]EJT80377.1 hypothetical protein GGTG_00377 [Gaeumannomyces tritici R3-111a-1]